MRKTMIRMVAVMLLAVMMMLTLSSCSSGSDSIISLKMSTLNPWIKNTDPSEIAKVEEIHTYYGIAPGRKMMSYYSEDVEVIAAYMEWLADSTLTPTLPRIGVLGGGSTKILFTFKDGSTKKISISQGVYYKFLMSFNVKNGSKFEKESMDTFYRFNVGNEGYSVYTCGDNPELIKTAENGLRDLGFIYLKDAEAPETEPTHYLETSFGKVYIYSDSLCYIDAGEIDPNENNGYYELYGAKFSDLIK